MNRLTLVLVQHQKPIRLHFLKFGGDFQFFLSSYNLRHTDNIVYLLTFLKSRSTK